jgi:oxygen-independent coproporphyrinogen-3 oxidase
MTLELLRRYSRPGPRYTSYPTAPQFHTGYGEADYRARLEQADARVDEPLSLYVHLPFCRERCHYCGCHVVIARRDEIAARYLDALKSEIDLVATTLPRRRRVSQLHWGGGTPTYHPPAEMRALFGKLTSHFELEPDAEVAIEVDPRVTAAEQIDTLVELGFNRISMGVQDFTPEVQHAIGREQTEQQTRELYRHCRTRGFESINLDLIYGLPRQTPESFRRNVETVLDLRPERLAVYSYAHLPSVKANQKRIDPATLPDPETKLELFCIARELFLGAGYVQIGMDHFVLPDDELALAVERGRLFRNFMGYTVKMGSDMIGLGISAIGDVHASFAQNAKKLSSYYELLEAGRLPIERGYALSDDDRLRREVITGLMCNFRLDIPELETRFGIRFADYFARELEELRAADGPVEHGFVRESPERIEVVGDGRLFVRNVCMTFDRYLREQQARRQVFSSTV